MNPERWERVAELYRLASAQVGEARSSYLDEACGSDQDLRREVRSLLDQAVEEDSPLERVARDLQSLGNAEILPANLGAYRVIRLIGQGGMGAVYEAEQDHPRRIVALKVMKLGLGTPDLLRRFEIESEALGRLQHPGIAQIYEAGAAQTTFGTQPYFAMEYIGGVSLVQYAEAHRLNVRRRLEIFINVCEAVHHAHQRGIVHRDLKPANILVDDRGQPKVLDFGVASIKDREAQATRQTDLGQLVGTLAYMSPEQVLGQPAEIDSASDVYSLGVVLYELLAGRLPYRIGNDVLETARIIREADPLPLGSAARVYRGDLETIVQKALEKDKLRRYASAAQFAEDLRHYLSDEPVLARPRSASYQIRKFVSRHKALAGATATVAVVLVAATAVSTWQAIRASRAERAAVMERNRATAAERAATEDRDRAVHAEEAALRESQLAQQQRGVALAAGRRADTQAAIATSVYGFLQNDLLALAGADGQSRANTKPDPNLTVRAALDRAANNVGRKFASQPIVEAAIRHTLGAAYRELGLFDQARVHFEQAFHLRRQELGPDHPDTLNTMRELGLVLLRVGKGAASEEIATEYLKRERRLGGVNRPEVLMAMNDVAIGLIQRGKYEQAEKLLSEVLDTQRRVVGKENPETLGMMNNLASAYVDRGKYAAAESLYQRTIEAKRRVLGPENPSTLLSMNSLAVAYRNRGKYREAEALLTSVLDARRRAMGATHPDTAGSMNSLGLLYIAEGRYEEAEPLLLQSLELTRRALGDDHSDTLRVINSLAELDRRRGRRPEAEAGFFKVLQGRRQALGPTHPTTVAVLLSLGEMKLEDREWEEASSLIRAAWEAQQQSATAGWRTYYAQCLLGGSLVGLGKYSEAEPLLISGYEQLSQRVDTIPFENRRILDQMRERISELYRSWGRPEEATNWGSALKARH